MSCVSCSRRRILKADRHEGLVDGAGPRLGHLPAHAAVGSDLARGGRGRGQSLWVAGRLRREGVGVLPHKVAHGASNELEAVRVRARRDQSKVSGRTHLQDLWQRNLLWEGCRGWCSGQSDKWSRRYHSCFYLVVLVGIVVLEKYDAFTVQTPVVPLSLLKLDKDGMRTGTEAMAAHLEFAERGGERWCSGITEKAKTRRTSRSCRWEGDGGNKERMDKSRRKDSC